jgi:hypothetical protein
LHAASGFFQSDEVAKSIGFLRPRSALRTPWPCALRFSFAVHTVWRDPDCNSLLRFSPPSGLSSQRSCPSSLDAGASLEDCRAVQRIRSEGVHIPPKVPPIGLRSGSRVSHPPSGLLLPRPRRFISPRKRPSASPFRDFPSQGAAPTLHRRLCRLVVLRRLASRHLGWAGPPAHHPHSS